MVQIKNKKAKHSYTPIKEFSAGLSLYGSEVKAVRQGKVNLAGAHVVVRGGEAFVVGMSIAPYQVNNTPQEYDPERPRRLLLHKKELREIAAAEEQKGLTIVPFSLYNRGRFLKMKIAIVRGKKRRDKREEIRKRDVEREIRRSLKYR